MLLSGALEVKKMEEQVDVLDSMQQVVKTALEQLGYPKEIYDVLKEPIRLLTVRIPVKMDDGKTKVFTGYRAQHNDVVGPTKGGIRFHPKVTEREVKARAMNVSLQSGIADLPFGGGKGGVICDPRKMSFQELERLSRGYIRAIRSVIGSGKDILSSDMFTNSQMMAWMLDEYEQIHALDASNYITGKPMVLGGTLGKEEAIVNGIMICLKRAAKQKEIELAEAKVIIQGFGNAGSLLAKQLQKNGATIVGIADANGALYDEKGLDIDYLIDRKDSFGMVTNLFNHPLSHEQLLRKECDILIPAAIESQITNHIASSLQAAIVVETGKRSATDEATDILHQRGILLIPDILASIGDLVVSYFEWVQNNQGYFWSEEKVKEEIETVIGRAFDKVYQLSAGRKINMRLASYMIGVRKMAEATRFRGWV